MKPSNDDDLADLYFAPTGESKANLLKENHPESSIVVTGNTAIDALKLTVQEDYHHEVLDQLDPAKSHPGDQHRRRKSYNPCEQSLSSERNGGSRTDY